MFVLGIDPGLTRCGYGVVAVDNAAGMTAEMAGVLTTDPHAALSDRLGMLHADLLQLLTEAQPDVVVVEHIFFQTNVRTAMSVAQASGIAIGLAKSRGCEVVQYTANEVKSVVAGYGAATKDQVGAMVQRQLHLSAPPKPADAADALALALCHASQLPRQRKVQAALGAQS